LNMKCPCTGSLMNDCTPDSDILEDSGSLGGGTKLGEGHWVHSFAGCIWSLTSYSFSDCVHHEVKDCLCLMTPVSWNSSQMDKANQPWTESSKCMSKIYLFCFKLFVLGILSQWHKIYKYGHWTLNFIR
jgi:hypothetical protein